MVDEVKTEAKTTPKKAEAVKAAPARKAGDVVKVKNISGSTLYLSTETLEKGKEGEATFAELCAHPKHLEAI